MRILLFGRRRKKAPEQFEHKNNRGVTYQLWKKDVVLRGGKNQTIYFFRKKGSENLNNSERVYALPSWFEVMENPRNGFLTIKRISDEHEDEE